MSSDDSILTVGCVDRNLGIIQSCNSQANELLNYPSGSLIGKNITKIMPEIFTQLHSTLMINFFSKEIDFSQTEERIVPTLTKDSLIIETLLKIRLFYYA